MFHLSSPDDGELPLTLVCLTDQAGTGPQVLTGCKICELSDFAALPTRLSGLELEAGRAALAGDKVHYRTFL